MQNHSFYVHEKKNGLKYLEISKNLVKYRSENDNFGLSK